MKNIDSKELKLIQLDVLSAIHKFCENNNIIYSMACGTMLGAVRHGGYIPWDDDIDIYLLREDYIKLIESFPSIFQENYELISLERDGVWDRPYAKAYDNRTCFVENANTNKIIGVGIDVYPIDKVPNETKTWVKYNKKRRFFQNLFILKQMRFDRNRSLWKNLVLLFAKIFLLFCSSRTMAVFLSKFAQKNNCNDGDLVFECVQGMLQKRPFHISLFNEIVLLPFEDRMFCAFKNYDAYLKNAYGDYMQLPPEEKRVTHHDYTAYWK